MVMSTNALGSLVAMALLTRPCTVPKASIAAATVRRALAGFPQVGDQLFGVAHLVELRGRRVQALVLDVDQQHRRAAFQQRGGVALADALRGAGDDRDLPAL